MPRAYARRRHRLWMLAMTLATLGWGTWWVALLIWALAPRFSPGLFAPGLVGSLFALAGLGAAVLAVRAGRAWLLFVLVPLFANASLLAVPWIARAILDRLG